MREIKFRQWESMFGVMIQWEPDPEGESEAHRQGLKGAIQEYGWDDLFKGSVFMQYTGLPDKNGKEIFEGDLYRTADGNDTGIIKYRGSGFYIDWLPPVTFGLRSDLHYVDDGEVIGNIHENKELLEA